MTQPIRGHQQADDLTIQERQLLYRGFFQLERLTLSHRLFNGEMSRPIVRELLDRGQAVAVLPYDPQRDEVVLVEQFRVGALEAEGGAWLIEVIAGMMEAGESPEAVVRREAEEEAGCQLGRLEPICCYLVSPGGANEQIRLYCAEVASGGIGGYYGVAAEGEDIRAFTLPFETAWQWLERGEINSASPIMALQWLKLHRDRLRRSWGEARFERDESRI